MFAILQHPKSDVWFISLYLHPWEWRNYTMDQAMVTPVHPVTRSMPDADEDPLAAYCIEALKKCRAKGLGYLTRSGMWIFDQQIWSCAIFRQPIFGEWDLEGLPPHVWWKSDVWFGKYCNLPRYLLGRGYPPVLKRWSHLEKRSAISIALTSQGTNQLIIHSLIGPSFPVLT